MPAPCRNRRHGFHPCFEQDRSILGHRRHVSCSFLPRLGCSRVSPLLIASSSDQAPRLHLRLRHHRSFLLCFLQTASCTLTVVPLRSGLSATAWSPRCPPPVSAQRLSSSRASRTTSPVFALGKQDLIRTFALVRAVAHRSSRLLPQLLPALHAQYVSNLSSSISGSSLISVLPLRPGEPQLGREGPPALPLHLLPSPLLCSLTPSISLLLDRVVLAWDGRHPHGVDLLPPA